MQDEIGYGTRQKEVHESGKSAKSASVFHDEVETSSYLLHAAAQRLDTLEEHPRVVRRDAPAEVAQRHGAHAQDVGEWREHLRKVEAPALRVEGEGEGMLRLRVT